VRLWDEPILQAASAELVRVPDAELPVDLAALSAGISITRPILRSSSKHTSRLCVPR
jgi:hypothetical protein